MFYHPLFSSTTPSTKKGISFPACYRHTYGVKKEKQTQKIFPIPSWCTPTPTHDSTRVFRCRGGEKSMSEDEWNFASLSSM